MTYIFKKWRLVVAVLIAVLLLVIAVWLFVKTGIEKVPTKGVFV